MFMTFINFEKVLTELKSWLKKYDDAEKLRINAMINEEFKQSEGDDIIEMLAPWSGISPQKMEFASFNIENSDKSHYFTAHLLQESKTWCVVMND